MFFPITPHMYLSLHSCVYIFLLEKIRKRCTIKNGWVHTHPKITYIWGQNPRITWERREYAFTSSIDYRAHWVHETFRWLSLVKIFSQKPSLYTVAELEQRIRGAAFGNWGAKSIISVKFTIYLMEILHGKRGP